MANKPRVKIVAVAKDEAAYIPEWVHHHLYFGFDAIEIHVNRTTDNSSVILDKISDNHSSVSWQTADWIDLCPGNAKDHIQFIVYARALAELRLTDDFTHVFFLDIDEFWCPANFSSCIKNYLQSFPNNSAIFFEWLNDLGDLTSFSRLPQKVDGNLSPLGKTILPVQAELVELRHHVPLLQDQSRHVLANGKAFNSKKNLVQALEPALNSLKNAFVYHRAHRSDMEYVSLVYRGRPGNNFKYKNNRNGLPKRGEQTQSLTFPDVAYEKYQDSYETFLADLAISQYIEEAQSFVKRRYQRSIEDLGVGLNAGYKEMLSIFKGVSDTSVVTRFRKYRARKIKQRPHNAVLIKDFALDAAGQDIDEAIELMKKAQVLRPKGPQIRKCLEQFEKLKATRLTRPE